MAPIPSVPSRPPRRARLALTVLAAIGLAGFTYFLLLGAGYYLTPVPERARHPGYWTFKPGGTLGLRFGMAGLAMMTLMHVYSARKRLRALRRAGPLRSWLDFHILLGIFGPLFVVLHSSFKVGGLVAISFWAMVAVALSGVFGRYLYLQIPRTRAGEEMTLAEVEKSERELTRRLSDEFGADEATLQRIEAALTPRHRPGLAGVLGAIVVEDLGGNRRRMAAALQALPARSPALVAERAALVRHKAALRRRIVLWDALHRLFHHWHVVHKPFAIVMYVFVVVHVAVATFAGYGFAW